MGDVTSSIRMVDDFFELTPRSAARDFWFQPVPTDGLADDLVWSRRLEKAPAFIQRVRGYSTGDLRFEPASGHYGKRMNDLLWCTGGDYQLASDRFVRAVLSVGATGFDTYPVDLRDRAGDQIPGYVGLVISGECGRLGSTFDDDAVYESADSVSGYLVRGVDPARTEWDGSDLFTVRGLPTDSFLVTRKVMDALQAAGATDVEVVPASQKEDEPAGADLAAWRERTGR